MVPPHVQAVMDRLNNEAECYKLRDEIARGHYAIFSYEEHVQDASVTVRLVHGFDSYFPGMIVTDIPPDLLVACNCGRWQPPRAEHAEATRLKLAIFTR